MLYDYIMIVLTITPNPHPNPNPNPNLPPHPHPHHHHHRHHHPFQTRTHSHSHMYTHTYHTIPYHTQRGAGVFILEWPPANAFAEFTQRVSHEQYKAFIGHLNGHAMLPYMQAVQDATNPCAMCCAGIFCLCGGICYLMQAQKEYERLRADLIQRLNECMDPFYQQVLVHVGIQAHTGLEVFVRGSGKRKRKYHVPYVEFRRLNYAPAQGPGPAAAAAVAAQPAPMYYQQQPPLHHQQQQPYQQAPGPVPMAYAPQPQPHPQPHPHPHPQQPYQPVNQAAQPGTSNYSQTARVAPGPGPNYGNPGTQPYQQQSAKPNAPEEEQVGEEGEGQY
jgi:hypothetical protein